MSFYSILFFHLKSIVTVAPLKQLILSLRMEEQVIRNVTPAKYVFIYDFLKKFFVKVIFIEQDVREIYVVPSKQQLTSAILDNKESSTC